jgi:hypothetical protein
MNFLNKLFGINKEITVNGITFKRIKILFGKYKYILLKEYIIKTKIIPYDNIITNYIKLNIDGTLTIKNYYSWDGASGIAIDTESFMRGSLVHDGLYQLMREGKIDRKHRQYADELLRDICIQDGMYRWRAWYVYWSVRKFAGKYAGE